MQCQENRKRLKLYVHHLNKCSIYFKLCCTVYYRAVHNRSNNVNLIQKQIDEKANQTNCKEGFNK